MYASANSMLRGVSRDLPQQNRDVRERLVSGIGGFLLRGVYLVGGKRMQAGAWRKFCLCVSGWVRLRCGVRISSRQPPLGPLSGSLVKGGDWRRMSGVSSCSVMGRVSRRDAETRRGLLCVAFSQRLCASAGHGFRYCVVEFLFHRGAVGRLEED